MYEMQLDVHTHTLASGHAYNTIDEMAREGSRRGLRLLGIADHAPGVPGTCNEFYFHNFRVLPRDMYGMKMSFGSEINILDKNGALSLPDKVIDTLDHRIAGIHYFGFEIGDIETNTQTYLNVIKNPKIDIISHPDDSNCPVDYETLVKAARDNHVLLEVNNTSIFLPNRKNVRENSLTLLKLCKKFDHPILVSSDAHYFADIGNISRIRPLLEEVEFPSELMINTSYEAFCDFLAFNRRKEK